MRKAIAHIMKNLAGNGYFVFAASLQWANGEIQNPKQHQVHQVLAPGSHNEIYLSFGKLLSSTSITVQWGNEF
jgi:DNA-binding FadR family transcriptional regulator